MESPSSWDLLTSSLFASTLQATGETWAFLMLQGLVRDEPGDREEFGAVVGEVMAEGEITGPSLAARIASRLSAAGLVLPAADSPDPGGRIAIERRQIVDGWKDRSEA